uniref:Low-density lipoprotein receptor-related protein 1B-like n=1 Tax=Diabrotica virgifera virgifera TaxID=50390 RepID=A0A6P7GRS2_DIAVI
TVNSTKPPSLEFDQLNRTNPFDNHTADATKLKEEENSSSEELGIEPLKPEVMIIISDRNETTSELSATTEYITTEGNIISKNSNLEIKDYEINTSTDSPSMNEHPLNTTIKTVGGAVETANNIVDTTNTPNENIEHENHPENQNNLNQEIRIDEIVNTENTASEKSEISSIPVASERVYMNETKLTTTEKVTTEHDNINVVNSSEVTTDSTTNPSLSQIHIAEVLPTEKTKKFDTNNTEIRIEENITEVLPDTLNHSSTEPPKQITTLPADIINNIHSNSYFDEIVQHNDINTSENSSSVESTANSSNVNNFNVITSSTEDLIALETTTNIEGTTIPDIEENDLKKSEPTMAVDQDIETPTTVVNVKNINEQKEEENEISTQSNQVTTMDSNLYEVKETVADVTTTKTFFVTQKTTTESKEIEEDSTQELGIIPLSEDTSSETPKQKKDLSFENNEISNEKTDNTNDKLNEVSSKKDQVIPVTEDFVLPKVSRCSPGQFHCVNGTSVKDSSYCIPIGDRCDSVLDCTDGSDEIDCMEEGCPNNYQCASKQCLKRHLVCDGILNCNDGSDEINCESWTCSPNEISCGPSNRCIPASWKCDGRKHCSDGSDEDGCMTTGPCPGESFRCSVDSSCMPNSWRCDGLLDCAGGEDEMSCSKDFVFYRKPLSIL